ncbi:HesA/MoeB/ThiF family protein [Winogradskyella ursingii]|uniref:HesA/MoeB/ThiF family protein n=1 Tax=Winogradskyella ursingii TaxID=2686079 RepID=UPI0015C8F06E|nr:HesA/MoeB/ThiF family protein [Winogradskyella ursingii]
MTNEKYIRQISLPNVGESGQEKLSEARVLVVGCGGLGHAVLPYLASSGIGTVGIIDGDTVSKSNLHRQVLFSENDVGESKVEVAKSKLEQQFPEVETLVLNEFLNGDNALDLFKKFDVIIDATDAIEVRYLINDACVLTKKPFVHASVYRFQFQVATFNYKSSGTYRCLYPNPPKTVQNCAEAGVMPSTVAMAGLYQANEVFKLILNIGDLILDKMLLIDALTNEQHQFQYQKKDISFITQDFFKKIYIEKKIKTISYNEAKKLDGLFLDVREKDELPKLELENYMQIPLQELENNCSQISKNPPVFIFCQSGKRSAKAFQLLKEKEFKNVYCLSDNAPEIEYEEKENSLYSG